MRMMRLSSAASGVVLIFLSVETFSQTSLKSSWDTHEELLQWIMYPAAAPQTPQKSVERLTENRREFVRLKINSQDAPVVLGWPGGPRSFPPHDVLQHVDQLQVLLEPSEHNAVKVTMRHRTPGFSRIMAAWAHKGRKYDEPYNDRPGSDAYSLPPDGEWHVASLFLCATASAS